MTCVRVLEKHGLHLFAVEYVGATAPLRVVSVGGRRRRRWTVVGLVAVWMVVASGWTWWTVVGLVAVWMVDSG